MKSYYNTQFVFTLTEVLISTIFMASSCPEEIEKELGITIPGLDIGVKLFLMSKVLFYVFTRWETIFTPKKDVIDTSVYVHALIQPKNDTAALYKTDKNTYDELIKQFGKTLTNKYISLENSGTNDDRQALVPQRLRALSWAVSTCGMFDAFIPLVTIDLYTQHAYTFFTQTNPDTQTTGYSFLLGLSYAVRFLASCTYFRYRIPANVNAYTQLYYLIKNGLPAIDQNNTRTSKYNRRLLLASIRCILTASVDFTFAFFAINKSMEHLSHDALTAKVLAGVTGGLYSMTSLGNNGVNVLKIIFDKDIKHNDDEPSARPQLEQYPFSRNKIKYVAANINLAVFLAGTYVICAASCSYTLKKLIETDWSYDPQNPLGSNVSYRALASLLLPFLVLQKIISFSVPRFTQSVVKRGYNLEKSLHVLWEKCDMTYRESHRSDIGYDRLNNDNSNEMPELSNGLNNS